MTRTIFTVAILAGTLLAAACNTVEGAGRDVQSAGNAIEKTVE